MSDANPDQQEEELELSGIPSLYFNGFQIVVGNSDILLILKRNNESIQVTNMSYTIAKTLAVKMSQIIQTLERKTDNQIMTTDYLGNALNKED